ncbi:hypothetical protein [Mycetohabitans endofungorum]|uniref:hypothetical protein n=1 Tax=Mycetohabitans endofungorum TaxID=417203 RepID=UPI002B05CCCF|nr:hypothetical protein [Mycetohabitans endofungorum]
MIQPSAEYDDSHRPSRQTHDADGLYIGLMSGTSMDGGDGVHGQTIRHRPELGK